MIKLNEDMLTIAMAARQLTLEGLADMSGVSLATLYRLKAGTGQAQAATLGKIANALGVCVEDIVKITDD